MEPLQLISGRAVPLMRSNIDTDVIIRIERLAHGDKHSLGQYAFESIRRLRNGEADRTCTLNDPRFESASILIAGQNFGCGSSREGAVVALLQMGFRCVIAESFGDIFFSNCFQNGLLPIRLNAKSIEELVAEAYRAHGDVVINLSEQSIKLPSGCVVGFEIDRFHRESLLTGLDDIQLTMRYVADIDQWQRRDQEQRPWIWDGGARAVE